MNDQITVDELEKASRNVQRLSEFIGERRGWILATDAEAAASSLTKAAQSLNDLVANLADPEILEAIEIHQPKMLEPSGSVSAARLTRFADFVDQLRKWFAAHDGSQLPEGSDESVCSLLTSLKSTIEALEQLPGPAAAPEAKPDPLISGDLGPVAEVDITARLVLDNTISRPLLQTFRGVTDLTPEAISMVDEFFAKQGIEFKGPERRRFHDKVLRWIQSTPDGQTLVVRLSGLSGKAEAYSSYRPRGS